MPVKALFDFDNIPQTSYTADTDLLALLLVGERFGHVVNAVKTQRMKVWTLVLFCTAWCGGVFSKHAPMSKEQIVGGTYFVPVYWPVHHPNRFSIG